MELHLKLNTKRKTEKNVALICDFMIHFKSIDGLNMLIELSW
jgi:hypothetical protein